LLDAIEEAGTEAKYTKEKVNRHVDVSPSDCRTKSQ
jgi:hypothetical protein